MRKLTALLAVAAILLAACAVSPADAQTAPTETAAASPAYESAIARARQRVEALRTEAHYPSISGAVRIDGALVWSEAAGYADTGSNVAATTSVRYPIGSISKSLTASAAMRLAADGVINLDAPIETYWRETPPRYRGITMRQLLSHQAGVRHYRFNESNRNREYPNVEAGLAIFLDDPPRFAPDQSFEYSTYGYSLASRVMEAATSEDFLTLMDRVLIDPLGMTATEADRATPAPANRVHEYVARSNSLSDAPETNSSFKWAGGGFVSTPEDLVRFGGALLAGEYIPAERFTEMATARRTADGEVNPQLYGLGWRAGGMNFPRRTPTLIRLIHHGGQATGAECILALVPDVAGAAAFCGNAHTSEGSQQLLQLAADVLRDFMEVRAAAAAAP